MIGTMDAISWTNQLVFQNSLVSLIRIAQEAGAKVILSTTSIYGERKPGSNAYDQALSQFSEIIRNIAFSSNSGLSELYHDFSWYEYRYNIYPETGLYDSILTLDGYQLCRIGYSCSPNSHGNTLVANSVAKGMIQILSN
eukprot:c22035_g1_i2.p1 GENE.c22035_g1_i2~~c22035_g1_i2.p1  ORF type:complete len:140 (-),score=46.07 c22035_g1_i2:131-550(-)